MKSYIKPNQIRGMVLSTFALLLSASMGTAQKQTSTKTTNPQNTEMRKPQRQSASLLERAEKAIYSGGGKEIRFTSTHYDGKGREQNVISGKMYLLGESFRLEYGDIVAVYARPTLSYYNAMEDTFTLSEPSGEELLQINPLHFLRSRARGFAQRSLPESRGLQWLAFSPEGKSNIKEIEIGFNKQTNLPKEITLRGKDGNKFVLKTSNIQALNSSDKGLFILNAKQYPGCEIVDLR